MNDERKPLDTVLQALAHAQPSPGMEQRIHASLASALEQEQRTTASHMAWRKPLTAATCTAVALVVLAAALVLLKPHHEPYVTQVVNAPTPHATSPSSEKSAPKTPEAETSQDPLKIAHFKGTRPASALRTGSSNGAADTALQNIPEPPEPLTHQEHLLVQLVRHEGPIQLASLTHSSQEQQLQRERDEVREFFQPPSLPLDEGQP